MDEIDFVALRRSLEKVFAAVQQKFLDAVQHGVILLGSAGGESRRPEQRTRIQEILPCFP
jgi:hypothetical protein